MEGGLGMGKHSDSQSNPGSLRLRLEGYLNDVDSSIAKYVNLTLVSLIIVSVICSMLITIKSLPQEYYNQIKLAEYIFASIFLVEYLVRIFSAPNRLKYIFSFYGLIDLAAILPMFLFGSNETFALRLVRTISLFRMMKLIRYTRDVQVLLNSLSKSMMIIVMLISGIVLLTLIGGNVIYLVEPENFNSAFDGVWWSLVTMSTVGYGDYVTHTLAGRIVAGAAMITGIVLFAIVTGLFSSRIFEATRIYERVHCHSCHASIERESTYCSSCGIKDPEQDPDYSARDSELDV